MSGNIHKRKDCGGDNSPIVPISIYTLEARGNVLLEVMQGYLGLSAQNMFRVINSSFRELLEVLTSKRIEYHDLKNALVPQPKKNEIVFVFDTKKIESSGYGREVFTKLIPIFVRRATHSVLCGDYIGKNEIQEKLREIFFDSVMTVRPIHYKHSSQFYLVYVNNMSDEMTRNFRDNLLSYEPYVGFIDLNYSSPMKTYLSTILCPIFLKHKETIIMGHEDDVDNIKDINMLGYPFEEHGYTCKSIQSSMYGVFLSYKIERAVFSGFASDTAFSINAITPIVLPLVDFDILLEDKKHEYLKTDKEGSLKKAGLLNSEKSEIEKLIREKINNNYIYNLSYSSEHNTIKFDILIERKVIDRAVKLRLALEYRPEERILRVITMF